MTIEAKNPHTMVAMLMPARKEMMEIDLGSEAVSELSKIPLSADSVTKLLTYPVTPKTL